MSVRKKLLTASFIVSEVFAAIYLITTAITYSLASDLYILPLVATAVAMIQGILCSTLRERIDGKGYGKPEKIRLTVYAAIGVVAIPSAILCALALLLKSDDNAAETSRQTVQVEPTAQSTAEKPKKPSTKKSTAKKTDKSKK